MENKNQEHQTNEQLALIVYVCIAIITGAFIVYRNKFNSILSDDFTAWGTFGDFMNPFIGIANIIFLIFLTYEVKNIELKREKEKDEIESKRVKQSLDIQVAITKSQMRNQEVTEIAKILNSVNEMFHTKVNKETVSGLKNNFTIVASCIHSFRYGKQHLFYKHFTENFDKEVYKPIVKTINELIEINQRIVATQKKFDGLIVDEEYRQETYRKAMKPNESISFESGEQYEDFIDDLIINEQEEELEVLRNTRFALFQSYNTLKTEFTSGLYKFILNGIETN